MANELPDQNPVTGRTAWDLAAEALQVIQRIGPTAIVVGGFMAFGYFFYIEVTNARREADQELQENLASARQELVDKYQKMGGMSDQLIGNIESLLALNQKIDAEVEASKRQAQEELAKAKAEVEQARAEADKERAEADRARAEADKVRSETEQARAEAEAAQIEVERLRANREKYQQDAVELEQKRKELVAENTGLEQLRTQYDRQVKALLVEIERIKGENAALVISARDAPVPAMPGEDITAGAQDLATAEAAAEDAGTQLRARVAGLLRDFASNPKSATADRFAIMLGMDAGELERIVGANLGYDLGGEKLQFLL